MEKYDALIKILYGKNTGHWYIKIIDEEGEILFDLGPNRENVNRIIRMFTDSGGLHFPPGALN